jgi:hypothetical protein
VVTERMLEMFKSSGAKRRAPGPDTKETH